jgi:hypothetical protein
MDLFALSDRNLPSGCVEKSLEILLYLVDCCIRWSVCKIEETEEGRGSLSKSYYANMYCVAVVKSVQIGS